MAAAVKAQFSALRASVGGRAGALGLADNEEIFQSLCSEGQHEPVPPLIMLSLEIFGIAQQGHCAGAVYVNTFARSVISHGMCLI